MVEPYLLVAGSRGQHAAYREGICVNPAFIYALSKLAAEMYLQMLGRTYGFPGVIMRFCNTYGRRSTSYVVEYFIGQALEGKPLLVKTPYAARDFLYINDHIAAYIAALTAPELDLYNIETGKPILLIELAKKIVALLNSDSEVVMDTTLETKKDFLDYIKD